MRKRAIFIDLSGLFRAHWHASENQEIGEAFSRTIAQVHRLRQGYDYCAVCCDAPPYRRKEILATYKAQRDAPPPQLIEQLRRTKERIIADGLLLWEAPGYEADDIIATAVRCATNEAIGVTVASGDKDLLALVNDLLCVEVFSPISQKTYNEAAVREKCGVAPGQIRDWLSLTGDSSDNIPGIPGVGPKIAAKLLADFRDLAGVITNAGKVNGKVGEALRTNIGAIGIAKRLVTLETDAPIDFDALFAERTPQKLVETEMSENYDDEPEMSDDEAADMLSPPPAAKADAPLPPPSAPREPEKRQQQQQAIVRAEPVSIHQVPFEHGLEPTTMGAAWKLASGLFNSRLYTKFPNPEAIWAAIIRGREMGLGALTSLDVLHVIEGKPAIHAHLIAARAKAMPECEYFQFVGGDDKYAEYVTKNRNNPEPTRLRYTIEQARRAGLGKGNWEKRPDEMLRKTCAVQLARIEYPSASMGLYAIEEFE